MLVRPVAERFVWLRVPLIRFVPEKPPLVPENELVWLNAASVTELPYCEFAPVEIAS